MPCFEVFEVLVTGPGGVEEQGVGGARKIGERDDVPEVERDDEEREEVYVAGSVSLEALAGAAGDSVAEVGAGRAVLVFGGLHGGFDLDSQKPGFSFLVPRFSISTKMPAGGMGTIGDVGVLRLALLREAQSRLLRMTIGRMTIYRLRDFDDEVIAGAIAPGFGDDEAVGVGASHKLQLDPLAAALRVAETFVHW